MSLFGLDAESVLQRKRALSVTPRVPSKTESLLIGAAGFGVVSMLVFASVAVGEKWLYANIGVRGAYILWTLLFIVGSGAALSGLVIGPESALRFFGSFALAFVLYAAVWTAAWFGLKGQPGEWVGSVASPIALSLVLCLAFGALRSFWPVLAALLVANVAGYFLGRVFWAGVGGKAGMVGWGIIYGPLLGAGIGHALYTCQAKIREALRRGD